jgi:hypothetical protein
MEMFRQIAPNGITDREIHVPVPGEDLASQLHGDEEAAHDMDHSHLSVTLGVEHTGPIIGSSTDTRFAVHRKAEPSSGGAANIAEGAVEEETTQSARCPFVQIN